MDTLNKIRFVTIFDCCSNLFLIKKHKRYLPVIQLTVRKEMLPFLEQYFDKYLSNINVYRRKTNRILITLMISENKNVFPLLTHLKNNILWQQEKINILIKYLINRTESNKKRYDAIDDEFYKKLKQL